MSQTNPGQSNESVNIDEQGRVSIEDSSLAEAVEALSEEDLENVAGGAATNQGCNNQCKPSALISEE